MKAKNSRSRQTAVKRKQPVVVQTKSGRFVRFGRAFVGLARRSAPYAKKAGIAVGKAGATVFTHVGAGLSLHETQELRRLSALEMERPLTKMERFRLGMLRGKLSSHQRRVKLYAARVGRGTKAVLFESAGQFDTWMMEPSRVKMRRKLENK